MYSPNPTEALSPAGLLWKKSLMLELSQIHQEGWFRRQRGTIWLSLWEVVVLTKDRLPNLEMALNQVWQKKDESHTYQERN